MAIDSKYGRVQLERGTIGEDEPVVVFRAQDKLLLEVLRAYRARCVAVLAPMRHLESIDEAAASVAKWQRDHPTQIPQSASE
jgi:hypothetical protein